MEIERIPEAETLFRKLATYKKMQLMLQSKNITPVKIRLQTASQVDPAYVMTDDEDGIDLFETLVTTRITQIETAIGNL